MKSKVTLKDIAMQVGVAEMTVSSALRNVGRVGKETRKKIIEAADQLGYRPNTAAQSMRSGRFGCLALLVSKNHPTPVTMKMLKGMESVMSKQNMHLILSQLAEEKVVDSSYMPQILRRSMADGLLIKYDVHIPDEMIRILKQHQFNIPYIWINSKHKSDCIYPNEIDAGRRATEHLINLGHRNIWYLTYGVNKKLHFNAPDRFKGYNTAMKTAGLESNWLGRYRGELPRNMRLPAIMELFSSDNSPTAVVTNSSETAAVALLAAARLNIKVPEELSIITFNEEPFDSNGILIDSMIMPAEELGSGSVKMLIEKINDHSIIHPPCRIKYRMEPGESCAPFCKL